MVLLPQVELPSEVVGNPHGHTDEVVREPAIRAESAKLDRESKPAAVPSAAPDLMTIRLRKCPVACEFVVGRLYRKCEVRTAPVARAIRFQTSCQG